MFQYFFEEYKEEIYDKRKKERHIYWPEVVILVFMFLLLAIYIYFAITQEFLYMLGIFLVMVGLLIPLHILHNNYMKKTHDARMEEHKEKVIQPLRNILESRNFQFVSLQKIDWLISSCEERLEKEKNPFQGVPDSFFKYVFPCITLLLGAIVESISVEIAIYITAFVFAAWIIWVGIRDAMNALIERLFCPNKFILVSLKKELEYARINFAEPSQSSAEKEPESSCGAVSASST